MVTQTETSWANLSPTELVGMLATFLDPTSVGSFAVTAGPRISSTIKNAYLKRNFNLLIANLANPTIFQAFLAVNEDWKDWYDNRGLLSAGEKGYFDGIFRRMFGLVRVGQVDVVKYLIEVREYDVNETRRFGPIELSPLRLALGFGNLLSLPNIPMLQYILSVPQLHVNARDSDGLSILHKAMVLASVSSEHFALLISHSDIDVNISDARGTTPLHYAACNNDEAKLLLLLGHATTNVNAITNDGWTPLHYAVTNWAEGKDFERVVKHLIKAGADPHVEDIDGDTPLGLLEMRDMDEHVALINEWKRNKRGVKRKAATE